MGTRALFPTLVYQARLGTRDAAALNARLRAECRQLALEDGAGRRWSQRNYPGGYTSYGSAHRLHQLSPSFARLGRALDPHVARFVRALRLDLSARRLALTDCWVNVMGAGAVHGLHLHPLSTLSGTYYVAVPRGAPGLKFEDPRLASFMAAPPRRGGHWVSFAARPGALLLFESWLRHEVPVNPVAGERISISFNYSWF